MCGVVGEEGSDTDVSSLSRAITTGRQSPPLPAGSESVLVVLAAGEDMVSSVEYDRMATTI